jgi:HSP20 family protein
MFKDYEDLIRQMEFEMQRCAAEAMRRFLELPDGSQEFWLPKTDVYETEQDLVIRVELAGIERESLHVALSADRRSLNIRGERSEPHIDDRRKTRYHQLEVYFGSFERDIMLPGDVSVDSERISAKYRDGFLIVTLPKAKQSKKTRSVRITEG